MLTASPATASNDQPTAESVHSPHTTTAEPPRQTRPPLDPRRAARRAQLKEQLANPYIYVEDVAQLTFEANKIYAAFKPRNDWQDWALSMIATMMVRLCRFDRIERRLRDLASFRAIDLWEEDQRLIVENQASKLPKQPGRVVAQLRQTPAGLDWLIARWEGLARDEAQGWTEDQTTLARQLLGGNGSIDLTVAGLARVQIRELRDLYDRVAEADAQVRANVEADLSDAHVPGLTKNRRDKKAMYLQMKWFIDQFHVEHPDRWDDPMRQPGYIAHDLAARYNNRPRQYNFTDTPPPEPEPNETKPPAEPAIVASDPVEPSDDETNPLLTASRCRSDETKPLPTNLMPQSAGRDPIGRADSPPDRPPSAR